MRLFLFLSAILLSSFLMSGCKSKPSDNLSGINPDQASAENIPDGERKEYYPNGNIHYIVEYLNGKANGRVREYTSEGKIYMDAIFKDGHRNGKCSHFYKNGNPFEVTNFINGEKDGIESKYYDDGKLLATIIYKKNKVQPGLKEYQKDGTEVDNDNSLVIKEVDHSAKEGKYFFEITLSKPKSNVEYYACPKADPESRQKLTLLGNAGILEIPVKSKHFVMKDLIFEAEYKTRLGNRMRLQKLYHHSAK